MTATILAAHPISLLFWGLMVVGGTLRLTRLVTSDTLPQWLLIDRLREWSDTAEHAHRLAWHQTLNRFEEDPDSYDDGAIALLARKRSQLESNEPMSWQARLVSGLSCPHCVGFWIGAIVLLGTWFLAPLPLASLAWGLLLGALTLNYLTAHISSRID